MLKIDEKGSKLTIFGLFYDFYKSSKMGQKEPFLGGKFKILDPKKRGGPKTGPKHRPDSRRKKRPQKWPKSSKMGIF
jgi:hypothetical protein